ncbi:MAG: molybdenum cofactor biosynthesis protein MoaE [Gemmatimonadaceae bacterium]|nr:molybdenum cofactor biosynthesis protein MoaE [Gemmatimonadaceae bacterium]
MRASLVEKVIDVGALTREVSGDSQGAVASFLGTVRSTNDGKPVTGIDYSAYRAMAEKEMGAIVSEASSNFGTQEIVVEHRTGFVAVGQASVAIVVSHERRAPALDAVRYIIEELKTRVPIWKCEHYSDGSRDWVHAGTGAPQPQ